VPSTPDLDALYRRYGILLRRRCRTLLRDEALADDALHEAFMNVMRHHDAFAAAEEPVRFLYRTVDNACFDQLRRRTRRREDDLEGSAPPASPHPGVRLEDRDAVVHVLASLPDDERRIAVYAFVDGMTQADIATEVGLSRVTVNKKLASIREHAKTILEDA